MQWLSDFGHAIFDWLVGGGWVWTWVTLLVVLMWVARLTGEANVKRWTAIFVSATGVAFIMFFFLELTNTGLGVGLMSAIDWGPRWLLTIGLWMLVNVTGSPTLLIGSGGGAKS